MAKAPVTTEMAELTRYELIRNELEERCPELKSRFHGGKGECWTEEQKAKLKKENCKPNDMRGRYPKSEEQKKKISESMARYRILNPFTEEEKLGRQEKLKGKVPWNKGRQLTGEDKQRKSLAHKGRPHTAAHTRAAMIAQNIRPTDPERQLLELLNAVCPGEYDYVGDGSVIILGMSPDFINVDGQKKIIELFGDYWHSPEKTGRSCEQEETARKAKFAVVGFECLVIWEHELVDIQSVAEKIQAFNQEKEINQGKANSCLPRPKGGKTHLG